MSIRLFGGRSRAMTLVELIVTMSLFFLLLSLIHSIFRQGARAHRMGESTTDIHKVLMVALARINTEARSAKAVNVTDKNGAGVPDGVRGVKLSFWPPLKDAAGEQIVVTTGPKKDTPQWDKNAHMYYKDPESGQLIREIRDETGGNHITSLGVLGKEGKIEFMTRGSMLFVYIEAPGEEKGGDTGKIQPWKLEQGIYLENMITP